MKHPSALIFTGALALALGGYQAIAADQPSEQSDAKQPAASQSSSVPEPIAVTLMAVDAKAKTITVREFAAVPADPAQPDPVDVKLPVASNASGQPLSDLTAGQHLALTCEVKQAVPKKPAMAEATHPLLIKDCVKVIKIEPNS